MRMSTALPFSSFQIAWRFGEVALVDLEFWIAILITRGAEWRRVQSYWPFRLTFAKSDL